MDLSCESIHKLLQWNISKELTTYKGTTLPNKYYFRLIFDVWIASISSSCNHTQSNNENVISLSNGSGPKVLIVIFWDHWFTKGVGIVLESWIFKERLEVFLEA